jgi:hypothetical protein
MNKEQQELLDEAYKNWKAKGRDFWEEQIDGMFTSELGEEKVDKISKEEFINKCKTDTEFSEKWGLKIEERELSRQERSDYYYKYGNSEGIVEGIVEGSLDLPIWVNDETAYKWYDKRNVPTKLITITYNDKTIESYE